MSYHILLLSFLFRNKTWSSSCSLYGTLRFCCCCCCLTVMVKILDIDSCLCQSRLAIYNYSTQFTVKKIHDDYSLGLFSDSKLAYSCFAIPNPRLKTTWSRCENPKQSISNGVRSCHLEHVSPCQHRSFSVKQGYSWWRCKQKKLGSLLCLHSQHTVRRSVLRNKNVPLTFSSPLLCITCSFKGKHTHITAGAMWYTILV